MKQIKPQKFTHYQKLHIAALFERKFDRNGKILKETPRYYEVLSSALGGRCGHRHKTQEAAKPCLRRMKSMMRGARGETR